MTWLLFGLAVFVGMFVGVVVMALAAAAKDGDNFWRAYERGYADGVRSERDVLDLPLSMN